MAKGILGNARLRFSLGAGALILGCAFAGVTSRVLNGAGAGLIAVGAALLISAAVAVIDKTDDVAKMRDEVDEIVHTVRRLEKKRKK